MFAVGPLVLPPFLNHPAIPAQHYLPDHRGEPSRVLRTMKHNVTDVDDMMDFQKLLTETNKSVQYLRYTVDKEQMARLAKLFPSDVLVNAPPPRKSSKHPISSILRDSLLETATLFVDHTHPLAVLGGDPERDALIFPTAWYHGPDLEAKSHYAERSNQHFLSCRHWPGCACYPLPRQMLMVHCIYYYTPQQLLALVRLVENVFSVHSEMRSAYGVLESEIEYQTVDPETVIVRPIGGHSLSEHSTDWLRSGYYSDGTHAMCWTARHRLGAMVVAHFRTCPIRAVQADAVLTFSAAVISDSYYGPINSAGPLCSPAGLAEEVEPLPDIPIFSAGPHFQVGARDPVYVPKGLIVALTEPYLYAQTGPARFRAMAAAAPDLARRLGVPELHRVRACTYAVAIAAVCNLNDETRCLLGTQTNIGFPKMSIYLHDLVVRHQWLDTVKVLRLLFKVGGWVAVAVALRHLYVGGASMVPEPVAPPDSASTNVGRAVGRSVVWAATAVGRVARGTYRSVADVATGIAEPVAAIIPSLPPEKREAAKKRASTWFGGVRSTLAKYFHVSAKMTTRGVAALRARVSFLFPNDPGSMLPEVKTGLSWNLHGTTTERGNWNVANLDSSMDINLRLGPFARHERLTTNTQVPFWHRWFRRDPPVVLPQDMDVVAADVVEASSPELAALVVVACLSYAAWRWFTRESYPLDLTTDAPEEPLMDHTHSRPPLDTLHYIKQLDVADVTHSSYKPRKMDPSATFKPAPLPSTDTKEAAVSLFGIGVNGSVPEVPSNNSKVEDAAMRGRALVETDPGTEAEWKEFQHWVDENFDLLFPDWVANCGPWNYAEIYDSWNSRFPCAQRAMHDEARHKLSMYPPSQRMFAHEAFTKREMLTNYIGPMYAGEVYNFVGKDGRIVQACKPAWNAIAGPFFYWITGGLKQSWHLKHILVYAAGYHADELGREMFYAEKTMLAWLIQVLEADGARWDAHMKLFARKFMHWLYTRAGLDRVTVPTGAGPMALRKLLKYTETVYGKTYHGAEYKIKGTQASGEPDTSVSNSVLNGLSQVYAYCKSSGKSVRSLIAPTATGLGLPPTMLGRPVSYVVDKAQVAFAADDMDEPIVEVIPVPARGSKKAKDEVLQDRKVRVLKPKEERRRYLQKLDLEPAVHQFLPTTVSNDRMMDASTLTAWETKSRGDWKANDQNPFYMVVMGDDSFGICAKATFHNDGLNGYDRVLARLGIEMERVYPESVDCGTFISARWWHCIREGEEIYCLGPKLGRIMPKMGYTVNTATSPKGDAAARSKAMGMVSDFHHVPVFNDYLATILRVTKPDPKLVGGDVQPMFHNYLRPTRVCHESDSTRAQLNKIYGIDDTARSYMRAALSKITQLPVVWSDPGLNRALKIDCSVSGLEVYTRCLAGVVEETLRRIFPWFTDTIVMWEYATWFAQFVKVMGRAPDEYEMFVRIVMIYTIHQWLASLPYVQAVTCHTMFNNAPMVFRVIWILHLLRMRVRHSGESRVMPYPVFTGYSWDQLYANTDKWTTSNYITRAAVLLNGLGRSAIGNFTASCPFLSILLTSGDFCLGQLRSDSPPRRPRRKRRLVNGVSCVEVSSHGRKHVYYGHDNGPVAHRNREGYRRRRRDRSLFNEAVHRLPSDSKVRDIIGVSPMPPASDRLEHKELSPLDIPPNQSPQTAMFNLNLCAAQVEHDLWYMTLDEVWAHLMAKAHTHVYTHDGDRVIRDKTKCGPDADDTNWIARDSYWRITKEFANTYGYFAPSDYRNMAGWNDEGVDVHAFMRAGSRPASPPVPATLASNRQVSQLYSETAVCASAIMSTIQEIEAYEAKRGMLTAATTNRDERERKHVASIQNHVGVLPHVSNLMYGTMDYEVVPYEGQAIEDDDVLFSTAGPTAIETKLRLTPLRVSPPVTSDLDCTEYAPNKRGKGKHGRFSWSGEDINSSGGAPREQLSVPGRTGISPAIDHVGVATNNRDEKKHTDPVTEWPLPVPGSLLECAGGLQLTSSPPACYDNPPPPMSKQRTQIEVKVAPQKPKRSSSRRRSKSKGSRSRSRSRSKSKARPRQPKRTTNRKESKASNVAHKRARNIKKMMKSGVYADSHTEVFHLRLATLDTSGLAAGDQIFSLPLSPMTFDNFRLTTLGTMYLCNDLEQLSLEIKSKSPGNLTGRMLVTTVADIVTGDSLPVTGGGQELLNALSDTYKAREVAYATSCSIPIKLTKSQPVMYNDIDSATSRESFYGLVSLNLVNSPTTILDAVSVTDPAELWLHGRVRFYRKYDVEVVEGKSAEVDMQSSVHVLPSTSVDRTNALAPLTTFHYNISPHWSAILDIASNLVAEVVPGGNILSAARAFYNVWYNWQVVSNDPVMAVQTVASLALSDGELRYSTQNTTMTASTIATAFDAVCGAVASMYYDPDESEPYQSQSCGVTPYTVVNCTNDGAATFTTTTTASSATIVACAPEDVMEVAMTKFQRYEIWKQGKKVLEIQPTDWKAIPKTKPPPKALRTPLQKARYKDFVIAKVIKPHLEKLGRIADISSSHFASRAYHRGGRGTSTLGRMNASFDVYANSDDDDDANTATSSASGSGREHKEKPQDPEQMEQDRRRRRRGTDDEDALVVISPTASRMTVEQKEPLARSAPIVPKPLKPR